MPRRTPPDRLRTLIQAATRIFISHGYRRTQMDDVAEASGISKATLYLSFESKDALFDAALRYADREPPAELPGNLPVRTPSPDTTVAEVGRRIAKESGLPRLLAALSRKRFPDFRTELEEILGEIYDAMARNRTGIKLLDRCALDHPELAKLWFDSGRERALALLTQYFDERTRRGRMRSYEAGSVSARIVLETLTFWAVHRHWDPSPQVYEEAVARRTVLDFLTRALVKD
jgi:AcrR family transcriptional regulator